MKGNPDALYTTNSSKNFCEGYDGCKNKNKTWCKYMYCIKCGKIFKHNPENSHVCTIPRSPSRWISACQDISDIIKKYLSNDENLAILELTGELDTEGLSWDS